MLEVIVPESKKELEQKIEAVKYQLSLEMNEKDRKIFEETLRIFEERRCME